MTTDKQKPFKAGFVPAPGRDDPALDPFEIEFRQEYKEGRGPRAPFVNEYGAVIGDHDYESPNSPLERWSEKTDPAVMSGDQWVHPYKDIGFRTRENRDLFERGIAPASGLFMHPTKQTARPESGARLGREDDEDDDFMRYFPIPEVLDEP
jgi:hypothetical protein